VGGEPLTNRDFREIVATCGYRFIQLASTGRTALYVRRRAEGVSGVSGVS
jgi:molybdenum cofactor biosynthesis enzyme MoaA